MTTGEHANLIEFLKTATDMELVSMQAEARKYSDDVTLNLILEELGRREDSHA